MKTTVIFIFTFFLVSYSSAFSILHANIEMITGKVSDHDRNERLDVCRNLRENIERIVSLLPSLTPEEEKWLNKEKKKIKNLEGEAASQKFSSIINSEIFSLRNLNHDLNEIIATLQAIERDNISFKEELILWNVASWLLSSHEINENLSKQMNLKKIELNDALRSQLELSDKKNEPWEYYSTFARYIQRNIIIPMTMK